MNRSVRFHPIAGGAGVNPPTPTDGTSYRKHGRAFIPQLAAHILQRDHGRRPLRCDEGPIVKDLAASQAAAPCRIMVVGERSARSGLTAALAAERDRVVVLDATLPMPPLVEDPGLVEFKNERLGIPWDKLPNAP